MMSISVCFRCTLSVALRDVRQKQHELLASLGMSLDMGANKFSQRIDSVCKSEFEDFVVYHREHRFVLSLAQAYTQDDDFPAPLNNMIMWGHYS